MVKFAFCWLLVAALGAIAHPLGENDGTQAVSANNQEQSAGGEGNLHAEAWGQWNGVQNPTTIIQGYNGFSSQLGGLLNQINGGGLQPNLAYQRLQSIAGSFQNLLSQFQSCSGCFGGDNGRYYSSFRPVFSRFQQLITIYQQRYPTLWKGWFQQLFQPLGGSFQSFFQTASSNGIAVSNFVPAGLGSSFSQFGLGSLQRFGLPN